MWYIYLQVCPSPTNMVVTALEPDAEVPKVAVVTGHLLNQERKPKDSQFLKLRSLAGVKQVTSGGE